MKRNNTNLLSASLRNNKQSKTMKAEKNIFNEIKELKELKEKQVIEIKEPSHVLYFLEVDEDDIDGEGMEASYIVISASKWNQIDAELLNKCELACLVFRVLIWKGEVKLYDAHEYKCLMNSNSNILSFRLVEVIASVWYYETVCDEEKNRKKLEKFFDGDENYATIDFVKEMYKSKMFAESDLTKVKKVSCSTSLVSFNVINHPCVLSDDEPGVNNICLVSLHADYVDQFKLLSNLVCTDRKLREKIGMWLLDNRETIGETISIGIGEIVVLELEFDLDLQGNEFFACPVICNNDNE